MLGVISGDRTLVSRRSTVRWQVIGASIPLSHSLHVTLRVALSTEVGALTTSPAALLPALHKRVVRRQIMPSRTSVCLNNEASQSSRTILSVRDGFHVSRIKAAPIAAQVVQVKTRGDGADQKFVGHSMTERLRLLAWQRDHSITVGGHMTGPEPALIRPVEERNEPITEVHSLDHVAI